MTDDEEIRKLEEEAKRLEESLKQIESSDYGSPEPEKKDSIFRFFREILALKDSKKVGNLSDAELGKLDMSVRRYHSIANYAEIEQLEKVAKYLRDEAEIISSTSMSRKGFFLLTTVTQIKKEQKLKEPSAEKKGWFVSKPKEDETTS